MEKIIFFLLFIFTLSTQAQQPKYSFRYGFEQAPPPSIKDSTATKIKYPKGFISGNIGYKFGRLIYLNEKTLLFEKTFFHSAITNIKLALYKELQLSTSLFYNFNSNQLPLWVSDAFYSLKWYNWRPHTFSFGYDNYAPNRFDKLNEWGDNFLLGSYFISYNLPLYKKWLNKIRIDNTTNFMIIPTARYSINYLDDNGLTKSTKPILSVSANYTIAKRFFIMGTIHSYPLKNTKTSWDPDFTYSFGYSDYRPWKLSITYGNWVVNRFNPKNKMPKDYGFIDGNISINYNYSF